MALYMQQWPGVECQRDGGRGRAARIAEKEGRHACGRMPSVRSWCNALIYRGNFFEKSLPVFARPAD